MYLLLSYLQHSFLGKNHTHLLKDIHSHVVKLVVEAHLQNGKNSWVWDTHNKSAHNERAIYLDRDLGATRYKNSKDLMIWHVL